MGSAEGLIPRHCGFQGEYDIKVKKSLGGQRGECTKGPGPSGQTSAVLLCLAGWLCLRVGLWLMLAGGLEAPASGIFARLRLLLPAWSSQKLSQVLNSCERHERGVHPSLTAHSSGAATHTSIGRQRPMSVSASRRSMGAAHTMRTVHQLYTWMACCVQHSLPACVHTCR